jgi:hypothetical protein|tara:strand:+ start:413 stop:694 length:282 start_codon:yes stop_codon:yes gene_type:complete
MKKRRYRSIKDLPVTETQILREQLRFNDRYQLSRKRDQHHALKEEMKDMINSFKNMKLKLRQDTALEMLSEIERRFKAHYYFCEPTKTRKIKS